MCELASLFQEVKDVVTVRYMCNVGGGGGGPFLLFVTLSFSFTKACRRR